jgi:hypothetical protein
VFVLVQVTIKMKRTQALWQFGADGKLKRKDLITGINSACGSIRVDRAGNIYAAMPARPAGKGFPEIVAGLKPDNVLDRAFKLPGQTVGTVMKFGPKGGKIVEGRGTWKVRGRITASFTGMKYTYCRADPLTNATCSCPSFRHDLDGFDRLYLSHTHMGTVLVVDSNYNRIMRIGNYGNVDNDGPASISLRGIAFAPKVESLCPFDAMAHR